MSKNANMALQKNYSQAIPLTIVPFYTDEYNNHRRRKSIILSDILQSYEEFKNITYDEKINIIVRIENSCTNEAIRKARGYNERCVWDNIQFINIYDIVCNNIISVLSQNNTILMQKILTSRIDLNIIANLSCKDLSPEKYIDITQEINKRVNTEQTVKSTKMYFCKKCKRTETTAERVQNRSGDEGSSFHITCLFCDAKWFS